MVNHPGGVGCPFYPKNNWLLVTPQKANSTCQLFSLGRRPPCPSASALPVTLSFGLLSARSLPFTPPSCGSLCVAPDCRQSESPTESPPATAPKNGAEVQRNSAGSSPMTNMPARWSSEIEPICTHKHRHFGRAVKASAC